jgi:hypothetical protein
MMVSVGLLFGQPLPIFRGLAINRGSRFCGAVRQSVGQSG